ncbi:hypothetical protein FRB96_007246 [Tulasnella sp. 330]|nr:hypothetical protein FRB96_007246 [Tulasnella sp. 330]
MGATFFFTLILATISQFISTALAIPISFHSIDRVHKTQTLAARGFLDPLRNLFTGSRNAVTKAAGKPLTLTDQKTLEKVIDVAKTKPDSDAGKKAIKILGNHKAAAIKNVGNGVLGADRVTAYFASIGDQDAKGVLAVSKIHKAITNPSIHISDEDIILADQVAGRDAQAVRDGGKASTSAGNMLEHYAGSKQWRGEPQKSVPPEEGESSPEVKAKVKEIMDYHLKQFNLWTPDKDLETKHYGLTPAAAHAA